MDVYYPVVVVFQQIFRHQPKKSRKYYIINTPLFYQIQDFIRGIKILSVEIKTINAQILGSFYNVNILFIDNHAINSDVTSVKKVFTYLLYISTITGCKQSKIFHKIPKFILINNSKKPKKFFIMTKKRQY